MQGRRKADARQRTLLHGYATRQHTLTVLTPLCLGQPCDHSTVLSLRPPSLVPCDGTVKPHCMRLHHMRLHPHASAAKPPHGARGCVWIGEHSCRHFFSMASTTHVVVYGTVYATAYTTITITEWSRQASTITHSTTNWVTSYMYEEKPYLPLNATRRARKGILSGAILCVSLGAILMFMFVWTITDHVNKERESKKLESTGVQLG